MGQPKVCRQRFSDACYGGIRLTAEREKPSDLIHENSSPHLNPLYDNQDAVGAIKVLSNRNSSPAQLQRAARTLEKAVEADSAANLMFSLGNVYLLGRGVAADGNRAAELLGKAACAGYAKAYHVLGMMYKEGRGGVARDFVRAYTCFQKEPMPAIASACMQRAICSTRDWVAGKTMPRQWLPFVRLQG